MTGSILQLCTNGTGSRESKYLNEIPEITFFKRLYRRHTPFSFEPIDLKFSHTLRFGGKSTCKLLHAGDLLYKLILVLELPKLSARFLNLRSEDLDKLLIDSNCSNKNKTLNGSIDVLQSLQCIKDELSCLNNEKKYRIKMLYFLNTKYIVSDRINTDNTTNQGVLLDLNQMNEETDSIFNYINFKKEIMDEWVKCKTEYKLLNDYLQFIQELPYSNIPIIDTINLSNIILYSDTFYNLIPSREILEMFYLQFENFTDTFNSNNVPSNSLIQAFDLKLDSLFKFLYTNFNKYQQINSLFNPSASEQITIQNPPYSSLESYFFLNQITSSYNNNISFITQTQNNYTSYGINYHYLIDSYNIVINILKNISNSVPLVFFKAFDISSTTPPYNLFNALLNNFNLNVPSSKYRVFMDPSFKEAFFEQFNKKMDLPYSSFPIPNCPSQYNSNNLLLQSFTNNYLTFVNEQTTFTFINIERNLNQIFDNYQTFIFDTVNSFLSGSTPDTTYFGYNGFNPSNLNNAPKYNVSNPPFNNIMNLNIYNVEFIDLLASKLTLSLNLYFQNTNNPLVGNSERYILNIMLQYLLNYLNDSDSLAGISNTNNYKDQTINNSNNVFKYGPLNNFTPTTQTDMRCYFPTPYLIPEYTFNNDNMLITSIVYHRDLTASPLELLNYCINFIKYFAYNDPSVPINAPNFNYLKEVAITFYREVLKQMFDIYDGYKFEGSAQYQNTFYTYENKTQFNYNTLSNQNKILYEITNLCRKTLDYNYDITLSNLSYVPVSEQMTTRERNRFTFWFLITVMQEREMSKLYQNVFFNQEYIKSNVGDLTFQTINLLNSYFKELNLPNLPITTTNVQEYYETLYNTTTNIDLNLTNNLYNDRVFRYVDKPLNNNNLQITQNGKLDSINSSNIQYPANPLTDPLYIILTTNTPLTNIMIPNLLNKLYIFNGYFQRNLTNDIYNVVSSSLSPNIVFYFNDINIGLVNYAINYPTIIDLSTFVSYTFVGEIVVFPNHQFNIGDIIVTDLFQDPFELPLNQIHVFIVNGIVPNVSITMTRYSVGSGPKFIYDKILINFGNPTIPFTNTSLLSPMDITNLNPNFWNTSSPAINGEYAPLSTQLYDIINNNVVQITQNGKLDQIMSNIQYPKLITDDLYLYFDTTTPDPIIINTYSQVQNILFKFDNYIQRNLSDDIYNIIRENKAIIITILNPPNPLILNSINHSSINLLFSFYTFSNNNVYELDHNLNVGDLLITDLFLDPSDFPNTPVYVFKVEEIIDTNNFIVSRYAIGSGPKIIYTDYMVNFGNTALSPENIFSMSAISPTFDITNINPNQFFNQTYSNEITIYWTQQINSEFNPITSVSNKMEFFPIDYYHIKNSLFFNLEPPNPINDIESQFIALLEISTYLTRMSQSYPELNYNEYILMLRAIEYIECNYTSICTIIPTLLNLYDSSYNSSAYYTGLSLYVPSFYNTPQDALNDFINQINTCVFNSISLPITNNTLTPIPYSSTTLINSNINISNLTNLNYLQTNYGLENVNIKSIIQFMKSNFQSQYFYYAYFINSIQELNKLTNINNLFAFENSSNLNYQILNSINYNNVDISLLNNLSPYCYYFPETYPIQVNNVINLISTLDDYSIYTSQLLFQFLNPNSIPRYTPKDVYDWTNTQFEMMIQLYNYLQNQGIYNTVVNYLILFKPSFIVKDNLFSDISIYIKQYVPDNLTPIDITNLINLFVPYNLSIPEATNLINSIVPSYNDPYANESTRSVIINIELRNGLDMVIIRSYFDAFSTSTSFKTYIRDTLIIPPLSTNNPNLSLYYGLISNDLLPFLVYFLQNYTVSLNNIIKLLKQDFLNDLNRIGVQYNNFDQFSNIIVYFLDKLFDILNGICNVPSNYSEELNNIHSLSESKIQEYVNDNNSRTIVDIRVNEIIKSLKNKTIIKNIPDYNFYVSKNNARYQEIDFLRKSWTTQLIDINDRINKLEILQKRVSNTVYRNLIAKLAWVRKLGHYIVEYVSLIADDQIIDMHTSEFMDTWEETSLLEGQVKSYENLICDTPDMNVFNELIKSSRKLHLPLKFSCCRNVQLSLPLISMMHTQMKTEVKLRTLDEVSYKEEFSSFYNSNIFDEMNNMNKTQEYIPEIQDAYIIGDYCFIDKEERHKFVSNKLEYIIEQVQEQREQYTDNELKKVYKVPTEYNTITELDKNGLNINVSKANEFTGKYILEDELNVIPEEKPNGFIPKRIYDKVKIKTPWGDKYMTTVDKTQLLHYKQGQCFLKFNHPTEVIYVLGRMLKHIDPSYRTDESSYFYRERQWNNYTLKSYYDLSEIVKVKLDYLNTLMLELENPYDINFGFVNTMELLQNTYSNPPEPSDNPVEEWIRENYIYFMTILERYLILFQNQSNLNIAKGLDHLIRLKENLMSLNLEYFINTYDILIEQLNNVGYILGLTINQTILNSNVNNYLINNPTAIENLIITLNNRIDTINNNIIFPKLKTDLFYVNISNNTFNYNITNNMTFIHDNIYSFDSYTNISNLSFSVNKENTKGIYFWFVDTTDITLPIVEKVFNKSNLLSSIFLGYFLSTVFTSGHQFSIGDLIITDQFNLGVLQVFEVDSITNSNIVSVITYSIGSGPKFLFDKYMINFNNLFLINPNYNLNYIEMLVDKNLFTDIAINTIPNIGTNYIDAINTSYYNYNELQLNFLITVMIEYLDIEIFNYNVIDLIQYFYNFYSLFEQPNAQIIRMLTSIIPSLNNIIYQNMLVMNDGLIAYLFQKNILYNLIPLNDSNPVPMYVNNIISNKLNDEKNYVYDTIVIKLIDYSKYIKVNKEIETIEQMSLYFNEKVRVQNYPIAYWNLIQPYQTMERIPRKGFNLYSFSLFPLISQPTGSANLSRMDIIRLQPWFNTEIGTGNPIELICIDLNMNVWRVMSGQTGILFETSYKSQKTNYF